MAIDKKISELTAASSLGDGDLLEIVQAGTNKKIIGSLISFFSDDGTDLSPKVDGRNIDTLTGYLKTSKIEAQDGAGVTISNDSDEILKIADDGDVFIGDDVTVGDEEDGKYLRIKRIATEGNDEILFGIDKERTCFLNAINAPFNIGTSATQLNLLAAAGGNVSVFTDSESGENREFRIHGYITTSADDKYAYFKVDDTADEFVLDRQDSNITGFKVNMPTEIVNALNITGGLKDDDVTTAIALGDGSNTSFNTTNKTIVGAVNEVNGNIPVANTDKLTISSDGQTAFTLSSTPSSAAAFGLYLNGQLREDTVDYSFSGTNLTWNDPGGLTLKTTDILIAKYNDVGVTTGVKIRHYVATDYNANSGDSRVRAIAGTGGHRFSFPIPSDFNSLVSVYLVGEITSGAAGSGKDIDLSSEYGGMDQASNFYSETDTTTVYDFTGKSGQRTRAIDLSVVLNNIAADQGVGVFVDHNGIGGSINYLWVELKYRS